MLHLVLCFGVWILIFSGLLWRLITISQQAINHLQRLHQIPCNKCAYFTGDYRLKCTVNPFDAMSEQAIGCRDFLDDDRQTWTLPNRTFTCRDSDKRQEKHSLFKHKLTYLK